MRSSTVIFLCSAGIAAAVLSPLGMPDWIPTGDRLARLGPVLQVLAIIAGTLISEDFTCIAVGSLIGHGQLDWRIAGVACFLGIYIGDLLFFFLGRLGGQRLLRMRFFSRSLGPARLEAFGAWFDRRPWAAIIACRFLPGIRVPLYLSVGALTHRTKAFFWWTCFFACIWTPALIALVVFVGEAFTKPFEYLTDKVWLSITLGIIAIYLVVRGIMLMSTAEGRKTLARRFLWPFRRERQGAAEIGDGETVEREPFVEASAEAARPEDVASGRRRDNGSDVALPSADS